MQAFEKISIAKLLKAQKVFERFRKDICDDRDEAGAIQAFEFCYELAWKSIKKILQAGGVHNLVSPRDCIRAAAQKGWIDDPELWFSFIDARNTASYTYDQELVGEVLVVFPAFSLALEHLITNLLMVENVEA